MNNNFEKLKNNTVSYFKGVRSEWGKITWPEKNQVVVETAVVVFIVILFTLFIYLVDVMFDGASKALINWLQNL